MFLLQNDLIIDIIFTIRDDRSGIAW